MSSSVGRSSLRRISGGEITVGCGCSGTAIWRKCNDLLTAFWNKELGVIQHTMKHTVALDIDANVLNFLKVYHPDIDFLGQDVQDMTNKRATNTKTESIDFVPWVQVFGCGCVCVDKSKNNTQRSKYKGSVREGKGKTSETVRAFVAYVKRARPQYSFFEITPELDQQYEIEGESLTSDVDWCVEELEADSFTAIWVPFDAASKGSLTARVRGWLVVYDLPKDIAERLEVERCLNNVFHSIRLDKSFSPDDFLLDERALSKLQYNVNDEPDGGSDAKKAKTSDCKWKSLHEELYSAHGLTWPPHEPAVRGFREREWQVAPSRTRVSHVHRLASGNSLMLYTLLKGRSDIRLRKRPTSSGIHGSVWSLPFSASQS